MADYYQRLGQTLHLPADHFAPVVENAEYLLYSGTNEPAPVITAAELTALQTAVAAMLAGLKKGR